MERSEVRAKTIEVQYSPVRLEQARLGSRMLYAYDGQREKKHDFRPLNRSVWQNTDQERTNQSAGIYFKTTLRYNEAITKTTRLKIR